MERWIDTSNLPKKQIHKNDSIIEKIDWKNSVGQYVPFKYGEIEGRLYIKKRNGRKVTISTPEYGDKDIDIANIQIYKYPNIVDVWLQKAYL